MAAPAGFKDLPNQAYPLLASSYGLASWFVALIVIPGADHWHWRECGEWRGCGLSVRWEPEVSIL